MLAKLSDPLQRHVEMAVRWKVEESRVLDVFAVAQEIRQRFGNDNVALEDIAAAVAHLGSRSGCALELYGG